MSLAGVTCAVASVIMRDKVVGSAALTGEEEVLRMCAGMIAVQRLFALLRGGDALRTSVGPCDTCAWHEINVVGSLCRADWGGVPLMSMRIADWISSHRAQPTPWCSSSGWQISPACFDIASQCPRGPNKIHRPTHIFHQHMQTTTVLYHRMFTMTTFKDNNGKRH